MRPVVVRVSGGGAPYATRYALVLGTPGQGDAGGCPWSTDTCSYGARVQACVATTWAFVLVFLLGTQRDVHVIVVYVQQDALQSDEPCKMDSCF